MIQHDTGKTWDEDGATCLRINIAMQNILTVLGPTASAGEMSEEQVMAEKEFNIGDVLLNVFAFYVMGDHKLERSKDIEYFLARNIEAARTALPNSLERAQRHFKNLQRIAAAFKPLRLGLPEEDND